MPLLIEVIEMLRAEVSQIEMPDKRRRVQAKKIVVALPRGLPHGPMTRQPFSEELVNALAAGNHWQAVLLRPTCLI